MTTAANPITSALVDELEAAYTNPVVRDVLEREAYGVINVIDLLIDFATEDHADELEHFLRWERLNRLGDERVTELHQLRVDSLLEANVHAGNDFIAHDDLTPTDTGLEAFTTEEARLGDKWRVARLAHERAVEDHANLVEVLEATLEAKASA